MRDDFDDSDDEIFHRGRPTRHIVSKNHLARKNRILRRTALSLRPISRKCYTDQHSPYLNSDSDEPIKRRKSKRNITWLTDNQMHKVGYPTFNSGYSEEDSRDIPETHQDEVTRRVTRYSGNKNRREAPKYVMFDFDDVPEIPRRTNRRRIESNDKEENKDESSPGNNRMNGRLRSSRNGIDANKTSPEDEDTKDNIEEPSIENNENEKTEETLENGKPENGKSSDSEDLPLIKRRSARSRVANLPSNNRKGVLESSSESEDEQRKYTVEQEKKYSLRDRPPRPRPPRPVARTERTMPKSVLRNERCEISSRKRYTLRRRNVSSSSDSSSSSSEMTTPRKGRKTPHSKNEKMKSGSSGKIVPIKPETLDTSIRFSSIGGLDGHIHCLKEMILLPMMYPEVFKQFQIQPPKGVLFHGPPGTGKTLIARALANECSYGRKKVSFFMRKGADLLSKWIGESEKQLRMLFEQAAEVKPSIIFFDELDGLAPVRSSRQDQIHASIVSTLLALMDGLDSRGDVVVIGATNRIDAIDPALRRPGRFDRELFFPLPSRREREEILNVHVSQWAQPSNRQLIGYLAENTVGYCGSDLKALCTEAVIQSFKRVYPQVYGSEHRLLLNPENVKVEKIDFLRAKSYLIPASQRTAQGLGRKLLPVLEPILQEPLKRAIGFLEINFPHGLNIQLSKVKLSPNVRPAQLLITGKGKQHGQTSHLAPALLFRMEHIHAYVLDLTTLHQEAGRSPEEVCIQVFNEARRNVPSIIYIPSIDQWWQLVSVTVQAILLSQLSRLEPNIPLLLLATSEVAYYGLPKEVRNIFSHYRKEILEVEPASAEARKQFFKPLIIDSSLKPPRCNRERDKTPPPLPRAPTPPPSPMSEEQLKKLYNTEEHTLRELRIFLRDMCKKLANNRLFFMFTKPVDTEEVPDYTTIIKQPMDLETMMTKVDFHRYECAKDFLTDIDLICANALEYNPARTSADKQIRHRACSLRDYAYSLIKTEMDSDFEEKCQDIKKKRRERKACTSEYLPAYIQTPDLNPLVNEKLEPEAEDQQNEKAKMGRPSPPRKRKFSWQKGLLKKPKKPKLSENSTNHEDIAQEKASSDESKENDPETSVPTEKQLNGEVKGEPKTKEATSTRNSFNCDKDKMDVTKSTPQSPQRRLSDLMSPSELLDNPLDFDDVDQALNESTKNDPNRRSVDCPLNELEKSLEQAAKVSEGYSLVMLLDLHNNLSRVIKQFSRTYNRNILPKELLKEMNRFKRGVSDVQEFAQTSKNPSYS